MSNRLQLFIENYDEIKRKNTWSYPCFHSMAALTYTMKQKYYDKETFQSVKREFQTQIGWTSKFNASVDDLLFALLATHNEKGMGMISMITDQSKVVKTSFKFPATQIYYCLFQLSQLPEKERIEALQHAKQTYEWTKRNHPFISSLNDLPLYTALYQSLPVKADLATRIEQIYNELLSRGFARSNGLLAASISMCELPANTSELGERAKKMLMLLKEVKLPANQEIYEFLPLLLQIDLLTSSFIEKLKLTYQELQEIKSVKWINKKDKMLISISLNLMDLKQQENNSKSLLDINTVIEKHQFVHYYKMVQMSNTAAATY